MLAAMGGNRGDVRKKTKSPSPSQPSSMFTVTQSLVTLLTRNKWVSSVSWRTQNVPTSGNIKHVMSKFPTFRYIEHVKTSFQTKKYFAECEDSDPPSSPQSLDQGREDTPLNLINALAACVLSSKLSPLYKQWAVKEFIQVRLYNDDIFICNGWGTTTSTALVGYLCSSFGRVLDLKSRGPPFNSHLG